MIDIAIHDDFLTSVVLENIQAQMKTITYDPPEPEKASYYGGAFWHTRVLKIDSPVAKEIRKNIKNIFKMEVIENTHVCTYTLTGATDKARPHDDLVSGHPKDRSYNCLIYIIGDPLINNGTGFYIKKGDNLDLNSHIGFKINRAILFKREIVHSPLHWAGNSSWRHSIANSFVIV